MSMYNNHLRPAVIIVLMLPFLCFACQQEVTFPVDGTTVEEVVDAYIQSPLNAGIVIGTISNDATEMYLFGTADKSANEIPDEHTIFEIGSLTKVFTTAVLADMASEGLLSLDDPVETYLDISLPEYNGREMTLYHLATHTAGFPPAPDNLYTDDPAALFEQMQNPYKNYTEEDLYDYLRQFQPEYPYGERIEYSNTGIALLGVVLEKRAGIPYRQLLQERILEPLNMDETRVLLAAEDGRNHAQGYNQWGVATPFWEFQAIAPAGALRSTLSDMLDFLEANIDEDHSVLGEQLAQCHEPRIRYPYKDYEDFTVGLGWIILPLSGNGEQVVWHNGGTGGFRSYLGFVKETATGVVVLSNSAHSVDDIGRAVLQLLQ
ncbi:MAG: serine hydrolase [Chitinivibrionales bacterium]|nr:serine hydrolase [Chitinivibrionales bacterium]